VRTFTVSTLALIGGFFAGIVLSDIIGIIGFRAVGIRFLFSPYVLVIACAVVLPIVDMLIGGRSR
jgi:uncharacterized protein DUF5957